MSSGNTYISAVSAVATVGTLIVWVYYARLLHLGFIRHEAPLLLIHQARVQTSESSACLIANLSREPVHVALILALAHTARGVYKVRITDYRMLSSSDEEDFAHESHLKEGPLHAGSYLSLGSFRSILHTLADASSLERDLMPEEATPSAIDIARHISSLELRVIIHYSAYIRPAAVTRRYNVGVHGDHVHFLPPQVLTKQWVTRRGRRLAEEWLEQDLVEEYDESAVKRSG